MSYQGNLPRITVLNVSRREQLTMMWNMVQQPDTLYWRLQGEALTFSVLKEQFPQLLAVHHYRDITPVRQLIVDEIDRVQPDDLLTLLRICVERQHSCHFVLMSRSLPLTTLRDPLLRPYISWQMPSPARHLAHYDMVLEVQALGSGWALANGQPVVDWEGDLPRQLFFYLIHHPQPEPSQIQQALWEEDEQGNLNSLLNAVNHRLRVILGGRMMRYRGGKYRRMNQVYVDYDVQHFQQLLAQKCAPHTSHQRIALLESAVGLYRGDFLTTVTADWAKEVRAQLAARYHQALLELSELYLRIGNHERAIDHLLRAAYRHPDEVQTALLLMRACLDRADAARARQVYHRYLDAIPQDQMPDSTLQQLALEAEQRDQG